MVEAPETSRNRKILVIIMMSYAMIVVDISIAITALPSIQRSFHLTTAHLSWVQNAYTLIFGGFLLLGARFGDIFGRSRIFIYGLAIFAFASLLIGISTSGDTLILARGFQGFGAALLAPSTLSLLSSTFPSGHERTKAFGSYAAVAGAAATVGLVLGGVFAGYLNWRVGFFINPPIAAVLIVLSRKYIQESERVEGKFDVSGAVLSTIGMALLVFALVESTSSNVQFGRVFLLLPIGVLILLTFIFHERNAVQPILPLHLLANKVRSSALLGRLLFLGAMAPFWFFTSQFLQLVLGFTPEAAGLAFLPTTILNLITARMVAKSILKIGNLRVLLIGLTSCSVGLLWLSQVQTTSGYLRDIALPMLLIGGGQGFVLAPLTTMGVAEVDPRDSGAASGVVNVAHQLGGSLGIAVEIFISTLLASGSSVGISKQLLATRIATTYKVGTIFLLTAVLFVFLANYSRLESRKEEK